MNDKPSTVTLAHAPRVNEEEEKKRIDESFETWLSQKRVQRKQEEEVGRKKTGKLPERSIQRLRVPHTKS